MTLIRLSILLALMMLGLGGQRTCSDESLIPATAFDTLVICPAEFQSSLSEWILYRQKQGHSIQVVAPARSAVGVTDQIRQVADSNPLKFVFLIGDVGRQRDLATVPTHYVAAKVIQLFGSEPDIATDNPYADLDGDGLPELALGRLPADSAAEVRGFLDRVIAYETNAMQDQTWRRNINFVAGVGGFGGVLDNLVEHTAKQIITELVPQHYQTSMTFGSWRSPYCPDPRQFSQTAIGRFNEGCLFWVYIGHGQPTKLDRVHLPDQSHSVMDQDSAQHVCCVAGNPIAIFLSCYTGAIDHREDCLAETILRQPCGPIAAICGTRVTMPYALSLLSLEIVNEYFSGKVETLGELVCLAKRRIVETDHEPLDDENLVSNPYREMILGMGKLLSPRPDLLRAECLEHAHLIHVLGDPLLRLKRPEKIDVISIEQVESSDELRIAGISPTAGELCVELVYRRDRFRQRPPFRSDYRPSDKEFRSYQTVYLNSHDLTCDGCHQLVKSGPFQLSLRVPGDASGECVVRCMLSAPNSFALGSSAVQIKPSAVIRSARRTESK